MRKLALAVVALSLVALAPISSNPCREVREQVFEPLRDVAELVAGEPDFADLSNRGCLYILGRFRDIPAGAQLLRELGARGVEGVRSRCTTAVNSVHYRCSQEAGASGGRALSYCLPQAYDYCGQWAYSMTNQPKYELAMELSTQIEMVYDKAQRLCAAVIAGDAPRARSERQSLSQYLESRVLPRSERLRSLSCGD